MTTTTRTYGPLHFEDLDPHRFEDLVRELIYDYRDWQSIEATGRSGADAGVDIRAHERVSGANPRSEDEEAEARSHPMLGNQWLIQCKREKEIGPKKLEGILEEINPTDPPYGYILAAACVFSRQSYDVFREALLKKRRYGVLSVG